MANMKLRGPKSQHTPVTQSLKLQSAFNLGIVCLLVMIQESHYFDLENKLFNRKTLLSILWKIKTIICVSSYLAIAYLLLLWSTSPSYFFILLSNCMLVRRMMTNKSQITSPPPPHPKAALMHPTNRLVDFLLQAPAPPWPHSFLQ